MRILWTLPYLPWPATNGGKLRQYCLLRQLAERGHRITLLVLSKDAPSADELAFMESFLERVIIFKRRQVGSMGTLARAIFSYDRPVIATVNSFDDELERCFERLIQTPFDVIQIEHSYAFQPFERALRRAGRPFYLTEHNCESSLTRLHYARLPRALRPLGRLDELRARIWEKRVLTRASCVIAVSDGDRREFSALGARQITVVANCIDTGKFAHAAPDIGNGRLLFLGNYDYAPNVDAVEWLCQAIMQAVWARDPAIRLSVYGHAMPAEWRARWPDPRLEFGGYAPDLAQLHAAHAGFIVPLRSGGGSKLKVLEAMASGMPVIGTAEAMSGLQVSSGRECLVAETAEQLAEAAVAVLRQPGRARAMGAAARGHVRAHHDWAAGASQLEALYLEGLSAWERNVA